MRWSSEASRPAWRRSAWVAETRSRWRWRRRDPARPVSAGAAAAALVRDRSGRVRVGWRLLAFLLLTAGVFTVVAPFVPRSLPWQALPLLAGSLAASVLRLRWERRPVESLGLPIAREAAGALARGLALGAAVALAAVALIAGAGGLAWVPDQGTAGEWLLGLA